MLTLKLLLLDFKQNKLGSFLIILLIAVSTALSVTVSLQERALREGSAQAADRFDLVVGAAGSEAQLVLSTVFLQPALLNLVDHKVFQEIEKNPLVAWAAPLALGDYYQDMPIIGTNLALLEDGGHRFIQGRAFHQDGEAVVGAKSGLAIGDTFSPIHGQLGASDQDSHEHVTYTVVGILPEDGSVWDRAILVPITSVWNIHQSHSHQTHEQADKHDDIDALGVSAIIIKPKSFAAAYQLRSQYKTEYTQAVFPAEVLVKMYALLGESKTILLWVSMITQVLVAIALLMVIVLYLKHKQKQVAAWRIFGAPRAKLLLLIWFALILMVAIAMVLGVIIGIITATLLSHYISGQSGFDVPIYLSKDEMVLILSYFGLAIVVALLPSFFLYRQSPIAMLR